MAKHPLIYMTLPKLVGNSVIQARVYWFSDYEEYRIYEYVDAVPLSKSYMHTPDREEAIRTADLHMFGYKKKR